MQRVKTLQNTSLNNRSLEETINKQLRSNQQFLQLPVSQQKYIINQFKHYYIQQMSRTLVQINRNSIVQKNKQQIKQKQQKFISQTQQKLINKFNTIQKNKQVLNKQKQQQIKQYSNQWKYKLQQIVNKRKQQQKQQLKRALLYRKQIQQFLMESNNSSSRNRSSNNKNNNNNNNNNSKNNNNLNGAQNCRVSQQYQAGDNNYRLNLLCVNDTNKKSVNDTNKKRMHSLGSVSQSKNTKTMNNLLVLPDIKSKTNNNLSKNTHQIITKSQYSLPHHLSIHQINPNQQNKPQSLLHQQLQSLTHKQHQSLTHKQRSQLQQKQQQQQALNRMLQKMSKIQQKRKQCKWKKQHHSKQTKQHCSKQTKQKLSIKEQLHNDNNNRSPSSININNNIINNKVDNKRQQVDDVSKSLQRHKLIKQQLQHQQFTQRGQQYMNQLIKQKKTKIMRLVKSTLFQIRKQALLSN